MASIAGIPGVGDLPILGSVLHIKRTPAGEFYALPSVLDIDGGDIHVDSVCLCSVIIARSLWRA